jgi:hypothetical protein
MSYALRVSHPGVFSPMLLGKNLNDFVSRPTYSFTVLVFLLQLLTLQPVCLGHFGRKNDFIHRSGAGQSVTFHEYLDRAIHIAPELCREL